MTQRLFAIGGLLVAAFVGTSSLMFANSVRAEACCGGAQPVLSAEAVAGFKSSPQLLLTQNPVGGGAMIARIRDLLLADSTSLSAILGLLPSANNDQKSAIAAGLAQAARLWVRGDPAVAQQIQQGVAETKDPPFILAYTTAAGDQAIGATGAGAAGSSGGPGGQTAGLGGGSPGSGGAEGIGGGGVNTGGFTMTGGTTSSALTGGSTTTTTSSTVSP
jgi:hypothetical protein